MYGTNISPDVMAAEALNSKNFRARISTEFVERFSGPLAAITKEFAAKGIQPSVHMVQPPPSGFEMRLGGQALCEMVSEYRQRNGIPYPPEVAEKIQNYRTLAPCLGIPAADDPFPGEKAVQIGTRAIDRANDIQQMANDCVKKMDGSDVDNDAQRRAFGNAVRLCCLDEIKKVHYAILSRCPTARDQDGERAYNLFLQEQAPGVTPSCDVDELAKYLREIGQTMKDLRELKR